MGTFSWSELASEPLEGGRGRTAPVFRGGRFAAVRLHEPSGVELSLPGDAHERILSVVAGRALVQVGDRERVVGPQEAVLVRAGTPFGYSVLEDVEAVLFREHLGGPASNAGGESFFTWEQLPSDLITPAYSSGRGPVISGERIEVARMFYPPGTEAKRHTHPNEQIQVALGGKVRAFIGGEVDTFGAGGGVYFPPGVEHGLEILEDYTLLNCKDIVPGWSVYHARWEAGTVDR
jgi:quercetin dioxygenase-like cupin family protein